MLFGTHGEQFFNRFGFNAQQLRSAFRTGFYDVFFDVGHFAHRTFVVRKNFEKTSVSGSKVKARGVPERSGLAGSSGKTTKLGDKAHSKQPDRADQGQIEPARASQVVRLLAQVERVPRIVSIVGEFRY